MMTEFFILLLVALAARSAWRAFVGFGETIEGVNEPPSNGSHN